MESSYINFINYNCINYLSTSSNSTVMVASRDLKKLLPFFEQKSRAMWTRQARCSLNTPKVAFLTRAEISVSPSLPSYSNCCSAMRYCSSTVDRSRGAGLESSSLRTGSSSSWKEISSSSSLCASKVVGSIFHQIKCQNVKEEREAESFFCKQLGSCLDTTAGFRIRADELGAEHWHYSRTELLSIYAGTKPFPGRTNLRCWGLLGTYQRINVYANHLEYFVHDDAWGTEIENVSLDFR